MKNQCNFLGNLGADPTVNTMQNGNKVVSFNIAVTDKWRDKQSGERRESTQWIPIVIFNENLAKVAENYLRKGSKVGVSGSFQTRSWEKDGQKIYKSEIVLQQFNGSLELLDSRSTAQEEARPSPAPIDNSGFEDEIPFS